MAERNNKEILYRTLRKELLISALIALIVIFLGVVLNLKAILDVLSDAKFFSNLVIQSVIGIAAFAATIVFSDLVKESGNRHLLNDWQFRTDFTKIVFMSFISTILAFSLSFGTVLSESFSTCLSYFDEWATLTAVILTLWVFWRATGLIRRVVGYSKECD